MPNMNSDFERLLEKMDLHQIEQLKLAKHAITFLEGQRRQLLTQIAEIDERIAKVRSGELDPEKVLPKQVVATSEDRPRKTRSGSLTSKIVEVLTTKAAPMSIQEIADAVRAAGYTSESKQFEKIVSITLGQMDQIERVDRGIYKLKA